MSQSSDEYIEQELNKEINKNALEDLEKAEKERKALKKASDTKKTFTEKIKSALLYTGIIASIISGLAYIAITIVMIKGFETALELQNQILFSVIGSLVGLSISMGLRNQGIAFAKKEPYSIAIMKLYYEALNRTKKLKKLHTISHYMVWATVRDIIIKGVIIATTTWFVLYIFLSGNDNWGLLGLAFANLSMFTGFGLIALSSAYDHYIDQHIPVVKERIRKLLKEKKEEEKNE